MIILEVTLPSGLRKWAVGLAQQDLQRLISSPLDACVIAELEPGVELHVFGGRDDAQLQTFVASHFSYAKEEHKA